MQNRPLNNELIQKTKQLKKEYVELMGDEKRFFKDKARVQWLQFRDRNTSFLQGPISTKRQAHKRKHLEVAEDNYKKSTRRNEKNVTERSHSGRD